MKTYSSFTPFVIAAFLATTGCVATNTAPFEFGNYDSALYVYSKHPEKQPIFEDALNKAIAKGRERGHIAPGLQAELGYCLLHDGDRAAALAQFKAEMASFPESIPFLTTIIAQNGG